VPANGLTEQSAMKRGLPLRLIRQLHPDRLLSRAAFIARHHPAKTDERQTMKRSATVSGDSPTSTALSTRSRKSVE
jgi:hypothetical protein